MLATEYKLIPLAQLVPHEDAVRRGLADLPVRYAKSLLEEPEIRYPFLYYSLLTHWPDWLNGDAAKEDLLYSRLYWFVRLSRRYKLDHDFAAGFESAGAALIELAHRHLGTEVVHEVERKVRAEMASNEKEIAVSFSEFTIGKVKTQFGLSVDENGDFFATAIPVAISASLQNGLKISGSLALKINTEKARSEMIVAPVLLEVYQQLEGRISLFSGVEWEVDENQGLRGRCDFLMGLTQEQLTIEAPVLSVVEVKNNDLNSGVGQCLAELVAARIFNQQNNTVVPVLYGIVTTGSNWRFLRLIDNTAYVDATEYYIADVERIVGIIVSMFTSSGVPRKS
ncbi:MAG TPA: hypothetical protein VFE62_09885 [Gemmataceae bacterium]|nr:hypothetical protein [Gemmataceae bacterium]